MRTPPAAAKVAPGLSGRSSSIGDRLCLCWLVAALAFPFTAGAEAAAPGDGVTFTVNSTADDPDGALGDGLCETASGNGICTLRAAIGEANAQPTDDMIAFDIPESDPGYDGTSWTIALLTALPDLGTNLSIIGPGANRLTITRAAPAAFRIFHVTSTGVVSFTGLTITNGAAAPDDGGGIINESGGTVNLTECTVSANSAMHGGGISNQGASTLNVVRSTISFNTAADSGGGINNRDSGTANVTNSTVFGNSGVAGGGIRNNGYGQVNVSNCTISGNGGRGLFNVVTGQITVKSSIVSGNFVGVRTIADVSGNFNSAGFNLITDADDSAGFTQPTDQTGTADVPLVANISDLFDNGGPTKTVLLFVDSPAIDKGTSQGLSDDLATDQRGGDFERTFDDPNLPNAVGGDGTDIGALEGQGTLISPTPTPARLGNISTRVQVREGDNVAIAGFIVTTAFQKKVIIRALGPSLASMGVEDAVSDPMLQLYNDAGEIIASNDNWKETQETEIEATGIAPTNDFESALIATLTTGAYTAVIGHASGLGGIGLVEVYDLDPLTDTDVLLNISTRGLAGTGEDVLIGGVIVLGDLPGNLVLRAIGPSLPFDPDMVLADPTLELHDSNGATLAANDDWADTQESQIMATGLAPSLAHESAILQTVTPGAYTAIVSGKNGAAGLALVEAYRVP